jgi:hypothetical protein
MFSVYRRGAEVCAERHVGGGGILDSQSEPVRAELDAFLMLSLLDAGRNPQRAGLIRLNHGLAGPVTLHSKTKQP